MVLSLVDADTRLSSWLKDKGTDNTPAAFVMALTIIARCASLGEMPRGTFGSIDPLKADLKNCGSGPATDAPCKSVLKRSIRSCQD